MKTVILSVAAVGFLAACAPMEGGGDAPPMDAPDQCKASQYQRFVGRNRSELPPTPPGETWRVLCSTCPMTMDYHPDRLNIIYETSTGVIREAKCG